MINSIDIKNKINKAPDYRLVLNKLKNVPLTSYIQKYKEYKTQDYISNNKNNLGQYYNYNLENLNDKYEYIEEINLDLELEDDNISKNIFRFKYELLKKIENIHYIDIVKIVLPNLFIIDKIEYIDNENKLDYIINNFNILEKYQTYENNNIRYNIHNKYDNKINISLDDNYEIVYEIILNEKIYKYNINKNIKLESFGEILLSINNLDNYLIDSTSNIKFYNILYIDKKINDMIYYKTRNCFHFYKKSNLLTLSNLYINIYNKNNNYIHTNKYIDDHSILFNYCDCNILNKKPGCKCTYILHKNYNKLKPILSIKIGIIKLDLIKKIIN